MRDRQVSILITVAKSFTVGKRLSHLISLNSYNNLQRQGIIGMTLNLWMRKQCLRDVACLNTKKMHKSV